MSIDDKVWFVAKDVAKALRYFNPQDAVRKHCKRYKSLNLLGCANRAPYKNQDVMGLDHKTNMIQEPDLYALVFGSKLPSAEKQHNNLFPLRNDK
ncbi:hypothetical protein TI05_06680 [Achromatium sp. WMS3]|nr:hypothetical protein TI05_06680 [Achromatium sp. WMS3]